MDEQLRRTDPVSVAVLRASVDRQAPPGGAAHFGLFDLCVTNRAGKYLELSRIELVMLVNGALAREGWHEPDIRIKMLPPKYQVFTLAPESYTIVQVSLPLRTPERWRDTASGRLSLSGELRCTEVDTGATVTYSIEQSSTFPVQIKNEHGSTPSPPTP